MNEKIVLYTYLIGFFYLFKLQIYIIQLAHVKYNITLETNINI